MVDHEVEDQVDVFAQRADIGPDSVLWINAVIPRDGEPIVRCKREEGEHGPDRSGRRGGPEGPEALQRCLTLVALMASA